MKKITLSLFFAIGFSNVWAQDYNVQYPTNALRFYGEGVQAGSARSVAMAGANGALGGEINSTEQNPAGTGVAISSEVAFTASVKAYKNKTQMDKVVTSEDNTFDFSQAGGTLVFNTRSEDWNRFVLGFIFLNEQLDNEVVFGPNAKIATYDDQGNAYKMNGFYDGVSGYKTKFTLNFGTSYQDRLFLGANFNFHETNYNNSIIYSDVAPNGAVSYMNLDGAPYSEIGQGFSFGLGIIGKLNQNLRAGLAFHTPVWYNVDEEYFRVDEAGMNNIYYSNYKLQSGARMVGSLGFVIGKSFAFDIDYTQHFNKMINFSDNNLRSANQFIDDNVNNSSEVRIGGEYRYDKFKVRAGYTYVQSPIKDATIFTEGINDQGQTITIANNYKNMYLGNLNRVSFGFGYDFGGFFIDAAYQYSNQKYVMPIGGHFVDGKSSVNLALNSGEVKNNNNSYLVTLGWKF
ncbi:MULTISPECIES: OmpP1/FadL family transporter [Weeksella]|uniref:OmpP1/FadL family transporter n=1 Tax=Weeksella TaxID=1013 RepID=UPI000AAFA9FE|nr:MULTISPECIES: hypothetical protein [Weeksella]MDK7675705.1 hypothetical protein [Weeksella virosa]